MSSTEDDRDGPLSGLPEGDTSFEGQSSLTGGVANTISDFYEEEELESESEINDANLLRSMLRESENFDPTHILMRGESGYPSSHRPSNENDEEEDEKQCWVCFATENDDLTAVWVHPCRCRGTTKWVHHVCIQRWVDEKQKGNTSATVECPQCGTPYSIQLPPANFFVSILDATDKLVQKFCPIVAGGFCVGSLYWTCVTYGAVVLMQTVGHDEGLMLMERTDPLFLLVALPLVPVGLVLGKMARWEEPVLKFLRTTVPKLPLAHYILPSFAVVPERPILQSSMPPTTDPVSVTRTFCGALFFPVIAMNTGTLLFGGVPSQLKRTFLGGVTFVVVKGVLKIYHKQHTYIRQSQRIIMNFQEENQTYSTSLTPRGSR